MNKTENKNLKKSAKPLGFSLIETVITLLVLILIVTGTYSAIINSLRNQHEEVIGKQALEIANTVMLEVLNAPWTYCLLGDVKLTSASNEADCSQSHPAAPFGGQSRYSPGNLFDSVWDYAGYEEQGLRSRSGNIINGLENYRWVVDLTPVEFNGVQSIEVKIKVFAPARVERELKAYKTQHSPNAIY